MSRRLTMLVAGTIGLALACFALFVTRVNRLGGVPHAEATELCLQKLRTDPLNAEMAALLRSLGTNAMPTITNYLGYQESRLRRRLRGWANGLDWLPGSVLAENDFHAMASDGATRLGRRAGPLLIGLFADAPLRYTDDTPAQRVDRVLKELGAAAVPALREGLQARNPLVRGHCALAIANHGSLHATVLVPELVLCAADRHPSVRAAAMLALGRLLEQPMVSVPALAKGLDDEVSAVRFHAAHSLWAFGSQARAALPAFRDAITRETAREDEGADQQPLGPKSRGMILHALTNAYATLLEHGD